VNVSGMTVKNISTLPKIVLAAIIEISNKD
jgi:hypothetical protein